MEQQTIEYIKARNVIDPEVFIFPEAIQNQYLAECLFEHNLLGEVFGWSFVDHGDLTVSLYMPEKTSVLLEKYDRTIIEGLDAIYALLLKRRHIITVIAKDSQIKSVLRNNGILDDALLAMLFDRYNVLPEHIRLQVKPYSPEQYLRENQN